MYRKILSAFMAITLLVLTVPQGARAESAADEQFQGTTPFQQAFQQLITEREAQGLPVPSSVDYEYEVDQEPAPMMRSFNSAPAEQGQVVVATTTIYFDTPQEAGYEEWPALVLKGTASDGDYSDLYVQQMEELDPDYWQEHTLGQEPRKYTFTETYEITYPQQEMLPLNTIAAGDQTTTEAILMGFTYTGPHIDNTIRRSAEACVQTPDWILWLFPDLPKEQCVTIYSFKAGFELDWAFGLRLPAQVSMDVPEQMTLGASYENLSATLTPMDWTADDYSDWGVAPEDGDEFVMRLEFFVGVEGTLLGVVDLCPLLPPLKCSENISIDTDDFDNLETSFETPFGEDAYFPIPALEIPIKEWGPSDFLGGDDDDEENNDENNEDDGEIDQDDVDEILDELFSMEIGISLQPQIGSSRITAKWDGEGDCVGEGEVEFTAPGEPASFGPVKACNVGPDDNATIRLSEFKYWFNEFLIELGAYTKFTLFGYELPWNLAVDLLTVDLGQLAGNPSILYLGDHTACVTEPGKLFSCGRTLPDNNLELSIPLVDLDAPTSAISTLGPAGNNGWYRGDVQVTLTADDNPISCGLGVDTIYHSLDNRLWQQYGAPFTISEEGLTTTYFYAADKAGNTEAPQSHLIKMDKSMPLLSATRIPPANAYGWNNTDVVIHFSASDAISGIASVTPDQALTQEGEDQQVTGSAEDIAGNVTTLEVKEINIDKTKPVIIINSPQAGYYANTSTFKTSWVASDALSGIASDSGTLDGVSVQNEQSLLLLLVSAGPHTFDVQATDKAGNIKQSSVELFVTTDINGLIAAKEYICGLGWINKPGVCHSLDAKLNAAKNAIERGRPETAIKQINAFLNELSAQNGKAVDARAYHLLQADALYMIAELQQ